MTILGTVTIWASALREAQCASSSNPVSSYSPTQNEN